MSNQLPARRSEDPENKKGSSLEPVRRDRVITVGDSEGKRPENKPIVTYHVSGDLHLHQSPENKPAVVKPESRYEIELRERLERQRLRDLYYLEPYPYHAPYRWWYYNHPDHWYGSHGSWRGVMMVGGGLLFLALILFGLVAILGVIALGMKTPAPATTNVVVTSQAEPDHPMTFEEYVRSQAR